MPADANLPPEPSGEELERWEAVATEAASWPPFHQAGNTLYTADKPPFQADVGYHVFMGGAQVVTFIVAAQRGWAATMRLAKSQAAEIAALKRERAEALAKLKNWSLLATLDEQTARYLDRAEKAERERDEWKALDSEMRRRLYGCNGDGSGALDTTERCYRRLDALTGVEDELRQAEADLARVRGNVEVAEEDASRLGAAMVQERDTVAALQGLVVGLAEALRLALRWVVHPREIDPTLPCATDGEPEEELGRARAALAAAEKSMAAKQEGSGT